MNQIINNKIERFLNKNLRINFTYINEEFINQTYRLDKICLSRKLCRSIDIVNFYKKYFNYKHDIFSIEMFDKSLLLTISLNFIKKYKVIPYYYINNKLVVLQVDPFDYEALNLLKLYYDKEIEIRLITEDNYLQAYRDLLSLNGYCITQELNLDVEDSIVKLVDNIIDNAIIENVSDIHFNPNEFDVSVRYRQDGLLKTVYNIDKNIYNSVIARIKILSNIDITKYRTPLDGRLQKVLNNNYYDCRVAILPVVDGERIVIRILNTSNFIYSIENIGYNPIQYSIIKRCLSYTNGIIIVTGPTGCGKTSTLYSFIKNFDPEILNIMTVEDPVEYKIPNINQIQVTSSGLTFNDALRNIIRQDPNIIMIGEIRDTETARTAIRLAITGHLVISTLHTTTASMVFNRLVDMGVEHHLILDSIRCVTSQRLMRELCPKCKVKYLSSQIENSILELNESIYLYRHNGCEYCQNQGYIGRFGVHEVVEFNNELKEILSKKSSNTISSKKIDYYNNDKLDKNMKEQVIKGRTSISEYIRIH